MKIQVGSFINHVVMDMAGGGVFDDFSKNLTVLVVLPVFNGFQYLQNEK